VKECIYRAWYTVNAESPVIVELVVEMLTQTLERDFPGASLRLLSLQYKPPCEIAGSQRYPEERALLVLVKGRVIKCQKEVPISATCVVFPTGRMLEAAWAECRATQLGGTWRRDFMHEEGQSPWISLA
jgi:hypothetical protein